MGKQVEFTLKNEAWNTEFGTVIFNGRFVFELDKNIPQQVWKKVGFIPMPDNTRKVESDDLFFYLNSRLPINLRDKPNKDKLNYIQESGLRVASDSFVLTPA